MSEVTVVGAGLAGLTAAINCARAGHDVRVLERFDGVGGDPYVRPAVDVTPMEPEALGRFIGVDLNPPYVVPTREIVGYVYGRRFTFDGKVLSLHSVERGSRSTSLDHYLYQRALEEGVEFEFGRPLLSQEDFAQLPSKSIIATGLYVEPFLALKRSYLHIYGFFAKSRFEGPERILAFFDHYTKYYCYCANTNGVIFALAFNQGPVSDSLRGRWARQLKEWEDLEFEEWFPLEGVVATKLINSPGLFAGDKILAGTLASMQDPFAFFGVHGSLASGKIAAMAVDDQERAWRLFTAFSSSYKYSWLVKKYFDIQPQLMRKIGLTAWMTFTEKWTDELRPLIDRVVLAIPGFGKV